MQLNDILEQKSVKDISKKTNISEDNLEVLFAENFASLKKVKALGFISILERDYNVDLSALKEQAHKFYAEHSSNGDSSLLGKEKKGRSVWFFLLIFTLLLGLSWYFFTQFEKKNLNTLLSYSEETMQKEQYIKKALSSNQTDIVQERTTLNEPNKINETKTAISQTHPLILPLKVVEDEVVQTSTTVSTPVSVTVEIEKIVLMPKNRLWFGIIDTVTGKIDQFTISEKYEIDVKEKSWLVATSTASFSFIYQDEVQEFTNGKVHHFRVNKEGIKSLSRTEYHSQGGLQKW